MAKAGFPGFKMNQGRCQLLYNGNNQWELSPIGGLLFYENATWTTNATAAAPKPSPPSSPPSPAASGTPVAQPQILYFEPIEASDMSYNDSPEQLKIYQSRQKGGSLYLVQNERIGAGLIDTKQGRVYDAESALFSNNENRMMLDLDQVTAITPSGVDVLKGKAKHRIEAWWNQDRLAFTIGQTKTNQATASGIQNVPGSRPAAANPVDPNLLFANSDFENGDLTNWTAVGTAFEFQPTKGDNPTARRRRGQPSNHQGAFWIGTFEKYNGKPEFSPGQKQGDHPTGTLRSVSFMISRERIAFLIGGGRHPDKEYAALVVDGREVIKATGKSKETMHKVVWNVHKFAGKQACIVIKDLHQGCWGHINADYFHFQGAASELSPVPVSEDKGETRSLIEKTPKQRNQFQQIMARAMNQGKQTNMKKGVADGLWKIIPKHAGDKIGTELKFQNIYTVTMGSNASLKQVFTFYEQRLKPEGWRDAGMHIQDGKGTFTMMKGQQMLTIYWADNPGMEGNYKLFYSLKLHGPDI